MSNTTKPSIIDNAITYEMSCSCYNPTKKVKDVQAAAAKEFGCPEEVFTGTIYLLDDKFTKELVEAVRKIRDFFDTHTLKLGLTSIIPSANFFRVVDFVNNYVPTFEAKADDFARRWEGEIRPNSYARLQRLGVTRQVQSAPIWKLSESEVRAKTYFEVKKGTLSDPDTLANINGLTDDLRAAMESDIRKDMAKLEVEAHREIARRMIVVLQNFSKKFRGLNEKSRVYDSITNNIADLADLIPSLVVNDDPVLIELAAEAKALAAYDIDVLKDDPNTRVEAINTAEDIIKKMSLI